MVGAISLAPEVAAAGPDAIFAKFREGVVASKKGTASEPQALRVKGYPACEMRFESAHGSGKEYGRMRLIVTDDRLVMLAYGSLRSEDTKKRGVDAFFDSLTIDAATAKPKQ